MWKTGFAALAVVIGVAACSEPEQPAHKGPPQVAEPKFYLQEAFNLRCKKTGRGKFDTTDYDSHLAIDIQGGQWRMRDDCCTSQPILDQDEKQLLLEDSGTIKTVYDTSTGVKQTVDSNGELWHEHTCVQEPYNPDNEPHVQQP
jgi:hypothetical protein